METLSTILSSFIPVAYADAPEDKSNSQAEESTKEGDASKEEGDGEEAQEGEAEAEEEEEPEDILPTLREECSNSATCSGFKKHFEHCQEKVEAGEGFKGEDCVEEM